ncbi:hypothetical protein JOC34_000451 [Virgibacillus halotolerans]|uniref:hypothetical protein n=1 Tax=Virgibacillus halotolerans TaxID=1071053 RepID=UPI001961ADA8|nr:hypothetical protein [Virgibacillus halotolerans]MBM7598094.1 hypothetical protein [Virgibacillus halotolerans]
MATPKKLVVDSFHTEFMSTTVLHSELEDMFLLKAIGDFELELDSLDYNDSVGEFDRDLIRPEITVLGLLMYKHYLGREKDRVMKINNIVGKDIKLTSMADSKRIIAKAYHDAFDEADEMMGKLKDGSYYE